MKRKKWIIWFCIAVVCLGSTAWGITATLSYHSEHEGEILSSTYTGRIYLDQAGYSEFKRYLADHQEITIDKLDILSSSDPLINFKFTVKGDKQVDYGMREIKYLEDYTPLYLALICTFGGLVFLLASSRFVHDIC